VRHKRADALGSIKRQSVDARSSPLAKRLRKGPRVYPAVANAARSSLIAPLGNKKNRCDGRDEKWR